MAAIAVILALWGSYAFAVDTATNLTGMDDSPYYRYEVRGNASVSIRLSQSLWEGGATSARIAMEQARLANSKYLYMDAASSLVFDGISAHVNVLRQRKLVKLTAKNVADYEKTIGMLRSRVENGLATEGDIKLVESRLYRAQGTLAEYQSSMLAALADFQKVTGVPAPNNLALVHLPKLPYKNVQTAISACRNGNPRLLAQQELITASQSEEKYAKSAFLPKVGIEAGPRWHFQDTPQDTRQHGVDAMLNFSWNLYDGGYSSAAYRRTAAQTRQERHEKQNILETLEAEIYATWAQYEAASHRMIFYKRSLDAAQAAREIYYEQYLLGTKGLLDILDAENEHFIAACQHEIASGDRIIGAYRLLALGGDILSTMAIHLPDFPIRPSNIKPKKFYGRP